MTRVARRRARVMTSLRESTKPFGSSTLAISTSPADSSPPQPPFSRIRIRKFDEFGSSSNSKMRSLSSSSLFVGFLLFWTFEETPAATVPLIRWCVIGPGGKDLCQKMATDLQQAHLMQVICVEARHVFQCMKMIRENLADAVNLDAEQLFVGGKYFQLKPLLSERVKDTDVMTDAIVVVKKTVHYTEGLGDLKGKRLCLSGADENNIQYQALVNVLYPLGFVNVREGQCTTTVPSLSDYFGQSCAPGRWSLSPEMKRTYGGRMCSLCRTVCTEQDYYAGASGAIRCLLSNDADVAVTSSDALVEANLDPERYHLLCIQGARRPLNKPCAWLVHKRNVVAVSEKSAAGTQAKWRVAIGKIFDVFTKNGTASAPAWLFKIVFSRADMSGVGEVYYQDTYERYLGLPFLRSFISPLPPLTCGQPLPMRWCVVLPAHMDKCEQMTYAFQAKRLKPQLKCLSARSTEECIRWVSEGAADLTMLRPDEAFKAYTKSSLTPIFSERYSDRSDATLYAVAVVKKSSNFTLENLIGARSCHPSANDILGWNAPLTMLDRHGYLKVVDCDYPRSAGGFFWESCVPEISSVMKNPTDDPQSLCALCGGSDPEHCGERSPFVDRLGALKCLTQPNANSGDIAFVVNDTFATLDPATARATFELLCLDGTRRSIDQYVECHWLKIPGKVAVVSTTAHDQEERRRWTQLFMDAQLYYGGGGGEAFSIFYTPNDPNTLFTPSTVELAPVWPEDKIETVMGEDFVNIYRNTLACSGVEGRSIRLGWAVQVVIAFTFLLMRLRWITRW